MKVTDVYKQYFSAQCIYNNVERKAAQVSLTATSDCGTIQYEISITFFPHRDEHDFAISYDAYASKQIYYAKGRRSKKREAQLLLTIQQHANELATQLQGSIAWDMPLREAYFD